MAKGCAKKVQVSKVSKDTYPCGNARVRYIHYAPQHSKKNPWRVCTTGLVNALKEKNIILMVPLLLRPRSSPSRRSSEPNWGSPSCRPFEIYISSLLPIAFWSFLDRLSCSRWRTRHVARRRRSLVWFPCLGLWKPSTPWFRQACSSLISSLNSHLDFDAGLLPPTPFTPVTPPGGSPVAPASSGRCAKKGYSNFWRWSKISWTSSDEMRRQVGRSLIACTRC